MRATYKNPQILRAMPAGMPGTGGSIRALINFTLVILLLAFAGGVARGSDIDSADYDPALFRSRVLLGVLSGYTADPRLGVSFECPLAYKSLVVRAEVLAGFGGLFGQGRSQTYIFNSIRTPRRL